jgi:hypothetical protein
MMDSTVMKIICSIDGGCKHHPCDIWPDQHRCGGEWFVDEICINYSKNNHEDEYY